MVDERDLLHCRVPSSVRESMYNGIIKEKSNAVVAFGAAKPFTIGTIERRVYG